MIIDKIESTPIILNTNKDKPKVNALQKKDEGKKQNKKKEKDKSKKLDDYI